MRKFYLIPILFISFIFNSCQINENKKEGKFDSKKWKIIEKKLSDSEFRKKMLTDLIHNSLTFEGIGGLENKGTTKEKVIELIGKPDFIDKCNDYEKYIVEEKYGMIDPNGYTYLNLKYTKNNTLLSWEIEETTFRE